jgi:hypothetical protein
MTTTETPVRTISKVVSPGLIDIGQQTLCAYFVEITYRDGRLRITAVEGPNAHGGCRGSCGQARDGLSKLVKPDAGWTHADVKRLAEVWDRWHLNDMVAGSPAQMDYLRANPITVPFRADYYTLACDALREAGLQPDPNFYGTGSLPYSYGSAWLSEEVPADVLDFLDSLPETTRNFPWRRH